MTDIISSVIESKKSAFIQFDVIIKIREGLFPDYIEIQTSTQSSPTEVNDTRNVQVLYPGQASDNEMQDYPKSKEEQEPEAEAEGDNDFRITPADVKLNK